MQPQPGKGARGETVFGAEPAEHMAALPSDWKGQPKDLHHYAHFYKAPSSSRLLKTSRYLIENVRGKHTS